MANPTIEYSSPDRENYSLNELEGARNQARDIISHVLMQAGVPKIYDNELDRMGTYQEIYAFLDIFMADDKYIKAGVERVLSLDLQVQKEFILGRLGKTKLDLSKVQLGANGVKVGNSVIAFITEEKQSYDDIKDDVTVVSFQDFGGINKNLGVQDYKVDFIKFCIHILGMEEGKKYRVGGSRRGAGYVVEIKTGEISCSPDRGVSDADLLPVLRKGDNEEFKINMLSLSEMPDQVVPETAVAQSALNGLPDGDWKNTIRIQRGTVFFEELDFGVLLFDTHIQLEEEIEKTVTSKFEWNEIDKFLISKGLDKEDRLLFYKRVLQVDIDGETKTSSVDRGFPVCFRFERNKINFFVDMNNDASLPMRKKVAA